ncbi:SRPBCC family protein [Streptomyces rubiginosohelvolus]|uniref:SRPBCC family protein n=1 Tax=Streptomyces rubiginosohelvolus TaxID=67362 RepID=UPI0035DF0199
MAKTDRAETEDTQDSGVDRLKDEFSKYASTQVQKIAEKAGEKLTDLTGQLTDVAENGGSLPAIGSRVLKGESPVKAFVSEKAKGAKDAVMDKAKDALGGGGRSKRKSSGSKVMNIIEVLDVGVPLRTAYDAWTQYEEFSSFAKGVRDVSKSDDTESDWKVKVGPSSRSFKATVLEQIPDDRIVWSSEGAKGTTSGAVSFHELGPTLTRIILVVEYYPSGFFEKTGNLWRAQGRRMRLDFKNFQRYVTLTEEEPEGWRGEIRDGEVVLSHEDAVEQEEAEDQEDEDQEYEGEDEDGEYEDEEYAGEEGEDEEDDGGADDGYEDADEDAEDEEEEPPAPKRRSRRRRAEASR